MKKALLPILAAYAVLGATGFALAEEPAVPSHTPIWTDHNDHDPGVAKPQAREQMIAPAKQEKEISSEEHEQTSAPGERVMKPRYDAGAAPANE